MATVLRTGYLGEPHFLASWSQYRKAIYEYHCQRFPEAAPRLWAGSAHPGRTGQHSAPIRQRASLTRRQQDEILRVRYHGKGIHSRFTGTADLQDRQVPQRPMESFHIGQPTGKNGTQEAVSRSGVRTNLIFEWLRTCRIYYFPNRVLPIKSSTFAGKQNCPFKKRNPFA